MVTKPPQRRRLASLAGQEADVEAERVRLCFGPRKLWRSNTTLRLMAIPVIRSGLGLAGGPQRRVLRAGHSRRGGWLPVVRGNHGGLRHGKYLVIIGVRFAHGHELLLAALESNSDYAQYRGFMEKRRHGPVNRARPSATGSRGTERLTGQLGLRFAAVFRHTYV